MIDNDFLARHFHEADQALIRDAFTNLTKMQVFPLLAAELRERVVNRFDSAEPEKLAIEILQVRQTTRDLLSLHGVGQEFTIKD